LLLIRDVRSGAIGRNLLDIKERYSTDAVCVSCLRWLTYPLLAVELVNPAQRDTPGIFGAAEYHNDPQRCQGPLETPNLSAEPCCILRKNPLSPYVIICLALERS
jgi:hypothetical protein